MVKNILVLGDKAYGRPFADVWPEAKIQYVDTHTTVPGVQALANADVCVFTGGHDVDPSLYGAKKEARTNSCPERDLRELYIFNALRNDCHKVGICRGSQFLRTACKGKLIQHIPNHGIHGMHQAFTVDGRLSFPITSTHHQAVKEGGDGFNELLTGESDGQFSIEAWTYGRKVSAVQYHPEYMDEESDGYMWFTDLLRSRTGEIGERFFR